MMTRNRTIALVVSAVLVVALAVTGLALTGGGDDPAPDGTAAPSPTDGGARTPDPAATTDPGPEPELTPTGDQTTPPGAEPELRGIWAHLFDPSLKTREGIIQFLDTAAAANFNTVIIQGARRHDAFYASDVLPPTTDDELAPGLDVLGELVPAAHERGLDVHVWYSIAPTNHTTMVDEDLGPEHITTQHGFGSDDPWLQAGNDPTYAYMDPAVPGFQDHVASLYREVVERYDVDGVHLDYIRYECLQVTDDGSCVSGAEVGAGATPNQNPVTMERFREHGDGSLADFMRRQTEDLVRRIYLEVADVDPSVVVSAAVISQGEGPGADREAFRASRAYWNKGQDWASWMEEDIVDHVYPMAYFREGDARWARAYDQWVAFGNLIDTDEEVVAMGQGAYLNCPDQTMAQLRESRQATDGIVLYSYQGTAAESGCGDQQPGALLRRLRNGMFEEPAPVPAVPRKADPTEGHVLVHARDGQDVTLTGPGGESITRRAGATGHAGFVWLEPGSWQVTVAGGDAREVQVEVAEVTRVDATG